MARTRPSIPAQRRLLVALCGLAMCFTALAPAAAADPGTRVPCVILNQLRGSLDDNVSVGIAGVRTAISSPYITGEPQKRAADSNLVLVSHGINVMRDIDEPGIVPTLANRLDTLQRATDDMARAVNSLFLWSWGGYELGNTLSVAWPQPSTWTVIDYADQKKSDIYALLDGLQPNCAP